MITINLNKAKDIGHKIRRDLREEEFKPYDEVISKQIPGKDVSEAEQAREAIRQKYASVQEQINQAKTADEIKSALGLDLRQVAAQNEGTV